MIRSTVSDFVSANAPLAPIRDPRATLPDLVNVILDKGAVLQLDLIISVADIPLIGVNVRAAIAGIETMFQYGLMRQWDERTRRWAAGRSARHIPALNGEAIVARMPGSIMSGEIGQTWRPSTVYVTTQRLVVHRGEPAELLWATNLDRISSVGAESASTLGRGARAVVTIDLDDGTQARITAADPERLVTLVNRAVRAAGRELAVSEPVVHQRAFREGSLWYLERRASGSVWRAGHARLSAEEGLTWQSPLDSRPAVAVHPDTIRSVRVHGNTPPLRPPAGTAALHIAGPGEAWFASDDLAAWAEAIMAWLASARQEQEDRDASVAAGSPGGSSV
jgi:hypothetical protein